MLKSFRVRNDDIINARRMCEGYCSLLSVCVCVCLSVTALALTYDVQTELTH